MISLVDIAETFITSLVVALLFTPLCTVIAKATGYMDHPKDIKVHARATPLLGGVAIYAAFTVALFSSGLLGRDIRLVSLLAGATILLVIGLIDDKFGMMPEVKLLGQLLAAMAIVKAGIRIEFLNNYYLNTLVTYVWIVGITNSFNLLDNMNGLSAGIAGISALFFGFAMYGSNQPEMALLSFALAGAAIGFLKHNFPTARIFMGDSGSLVLGFVLSSIAIMGSWKSKYLSTSIAMPLIMLAYPIFDTTLVTLVRIKEGRSIFQGGKDHSSHRLSLLGFRRRRAVLVIYVICIMLGIAALMVQRLPIRQALGVIGCVAAGLALLGLRLVMVDTTRFGRKKKGRIGE